MCLDERDAAVVIDRDMQEVISDLAVSP
jgi:hypothetical protein